MLQIFYQIIISLVVFIVSYILMNYFFEPVKMQNQIKKRIVTLLKVYKAEILSFELNDYPVEKIELVQKEFISLSAELQLISSVPFFDILSEMDFLLDEEVIIRVCKNLNSLSYFPYFKYDKYESVNDIYYLIKSIENDFKISIINTETYNKSKNKEVKNDEQT